MIRFYFLPLLLLTSTAHAGDVWINLYGYSYHPDNVHLQNKLNGDNNGWGLRYQFNKNVFADGGRFFDSYRNKSVYAGAALQTSNERLFSVGLEAFVMRRPSYNHGDAFIAGLPFLALNTGRVTTTMGYIPGREKVGDYILYTTYFFFWSVKL